MHVAFPRNVQAFSAFCGLFAYAADLRHVHGVKVGIRGLDCGESLPGLLREVTAEISVMVAMLLIHTVLSDKDTPFSTCSSPCSDALFRFFSCPNQIVESDNFYFFDD
jgi:hypothetical protein